MHSRLVRYVDSQVACKVQSPGFSVEFLARFRTKLAIYSTRARASQTQTDRTVGLYDDKYNVAELDPHDNNDGRLHVVLTFNSELFPEFPYFVGSHGRLPRDLSPVVQLESWQSHPRSSRERNSLL